MLIMAKTKTRILDADELMFLQDNSEDLKKIIVDAEAEDKKEPEDPSTTMNETEVSFNTISF